MTSNDTRSLVATANRTPSFYRLGQQVNERITDVDRMMEVTGIDKVHYDIEPAVLPEGVARFITPTNHTTWVNPFTGEKEILGTVGGKYTVIQPRDVFGLFEGLKHPWDAMGLFNDGRSMFGAIEWEREISLDPNGVDEKIKSWLVVRSSNDGSGALTGGRTAMRWECTNQFRMMFKNLNDKFLVKHTESAHKRMAVIKAELAKTDTYFDLVEKASKEMYRAPLTNDAFWSIVKTEMFPRPEKDVRGAEKKWENKMELIASAWNAPHNANVHGTVYGGFQTLLEWNQWGRNIQHGRDTVSSVTNLPAGEENFWSAGAGFDPTVENFRGNVFKRFYDLVPAKDRSLTV
jgi:hypothetical protein